MTHHVAATPFGQRAMSLGLIASQARIRQARAAMPEVTIHKWKVFAALTEARQRLGLSDRALVVLDALLSFHPDTTMSTGDALVVFPSNARLMARAHGVAPATLRRQIALLVEAGIVIRRDSPNGKRYARRGEGGVVSEAFGFDLTPLVARAAEFERLAAEVQAEKKALRLARERVTLARRDVTKLIALGLEEGIDGDWDGLHAAYLALVAGLTRGADAARLAGIATALEDLAAGISNHLELFTVSAEMSGNESRSERHKQNSKSDSHESEPACQEATGAAQDIPDTREATETRETKPVPLALVLSACPEIIQYACSDGRSGAGRQEWAGRTEPRIDSWPAFLATAGLVRAMLGISPDAWRDAVETFGAVDAAILVAAILQKGDEVRFPGGYLRALTEKKRQGGLSTGPILMALLNGARQRTGRAGA